MMLVNTHLFMSVRLIPILFLFLTSRVNAQQWTLSQCIDTARMYNKSLKIAQADILIAHEKSKEAIAGLIPKLYGNADYRYYTDLPYQLLPASVFNGPPGVYKEAQFGVPHNLNANLTLDFTLYNPQVMGAIEMTKRAKEISQIQLKQTEEQLVFEVSNLYYNAQLLLNQIVFIQSGISNSEKLLSTIQLLYSQQMVKGTDVDKVKLQQRQLITQISKVRSQYDQIINLLKLQMGVAGTSTLNIVESFVNTTETSEYLTREMPEQLLFVAKSQLIRADLKTLKRSHLPSFSLYASYGTMGYGNYTGTNDFFNTYPIGFGGVKMSWLLFSGTTLEHRVFQKKEELIQNNLRLESLIDKQAVQVSNARMQYNVALENLLNSKSQLELAEAIYSKTLIQQKEGVATLTDVILSDNVQKEAQQNYLSALVDVMKSDLELKRVTGNGLK